ncbi:MAG: hypothetical protein AAB659_01335 [Patescibacteria group bacterium]
MFRFIASVFIVTVTSLFQLSNYALIGGIKPNIALALLIVLSLIYTSWTKRALLIFVSAVILKFGSGFDLQNAVFIITSVLSMGAVNRLPFHKLTNAILALLVSTLAINLVHFSPIVFAAEAFYNLALFLLFFAIQRLWQER